MTLLNVHTISPHGAPPCARRTRCWSSCSASPTQCAPPIPSRLADAIIANELKSDVVLGANASAPSNVNLAALPPAFRAQAEAINGVNNAAREAEVDEETEKEIAMGARTRTGVPLPFADPAVGGGLFPSRILKWHGEKISDVPIEQRAEDTRTLLSSMQLLDVCEIAAEMTRRRLLLSAIRANLVRLNDEPVEGYLTRSEAESILADVVLVNVSSFPNDNKFNSHCLF